MKNKLTKSTPIRPSIKFNTTTKKSDKSQKDGDLETSKKLRTSKKSKIGTSLINPASAASKSRKSMAVTSSKKKTEIKKNDDKKKSIIRKSVFVKPTNFEKATKTNPRKSVAPKKNSMSVSLKRDDKNKKSKTTNFQNVNLFNSQKKKSIRKSIKTSTKKSTKNNDNLRSSELFNKNESLKINTIDSINDENENSSIVNQGENIKNNNNQENENEKNLIDNRINNINENNNKDNLKENIPMQNELIKEKLGNDFIKYSHPNSNFQIINENNPFQEPKLKNKFVETSNYISEKNKNMMRSLLHLLDKKIDDKKKQSNAFRSSINNLDKKEKNKISDITYKNNKKIYKMKFQEEAKNMNPINNIKIISEPKTDINNNINENNLLEFGTFNIEDKYQNMKNKYLIMVSKPMKQHPIYYKDKYFIDYVDGKCPNRDIFEKNMKYDKNIIANHNGFNTDIHRLNKSYNQKFKFMDKNNLSVEKRDNRFIYYNYGSMVNNINNKLNGSIQDRDFLNILKKTNSDFGMDQNFTQRNSKNNNLFNDINNDFNRMTAYDYRPRKTFSERNSLY